MPKDQNYERIEQAILFVKSNFRNQPSLEQIASHVNLSPFHFQRMFTEWAGVSPKKFLQYLTVEELKKELHHTENLIEAAMKSGLSAQSRVYDLFVNIESVTPNEFKTKGKGIEIGYGMHETPFGECFIAFTARGICSMSFTEDLKFSADELRNHWSNAAVKENYKTASHILSEIFSVENKRKEFKLFLKGTKFQIKVWEALLKIPFGNVSSYQQIAKWIKHDKAVRAVGSAVAANPIAFLIPCHRVIRSEGVTGNYHWGSGRKTALLGWEKCKLADKTDAE